MIKIDRPILITGAAGFIGAALTEKLLRENYSVIGIDNMNSYYDVNLKRERIRNIRKVSRAKKTDWVFF